jgi:hypothetical protein
MHYMQYTALVIQDMRCFDAKNAPRALQLTALCYFGCTQQRVMTMRLKLSNSYSYRCPTFLLT